MEIKPIANISLCEKISLCVHLESTQKWFVPYTPNFFHEIPCKKKGGLHLLCSHPLSTGAQWQGLPFSGLNKPNSLGPSSHGIFPVRDHLCGPPLDPLQPIPRDKPWEEWDSAVLISAGAAVVEEPSTLLAFFAGAAHCSLSLSFLPTRTPSPLPQSCFPDGYIPACAALLDEIYVYRYKYTHYIYILYMICKIFCCCSSVIFTLIKIKPL